MYITTITQKGQATIPVLIRNRMGFKPGQKVVWTQENGDVKLRPARDFFSFRGSIKLKRKFSQKLIHDEEKAAQEYVVGQYLKKLKRMEKHG